jgi:voltage-gated sodium channel
MGREIKHAAEGELQRVQNRLQHMGEQFAETGAAARGAIEDPTASKFLRARKSLEQSVRGVGNGDDNDSEDDGEDSSNNEADEHHEEESLCRLLFDAEPIELNDGDEEQVIIYDHVKNSSSFWKYQLRVHKIYTTVHVQVAVFSLISLNFLLECVQRMKVEWIREADSRKMSLWKACDNVFNTIFIVEVLFHAYGDWRDVFWSSKWNWFDCIIVTGGLLDILGIRFPGCDVVTMLRILRIFRLFRVFRLVGRVDAWKKVLNSLVQATPSTLHAFLIISIVMTIYAVIAVDLYSHLYCSRTERPDNYDCCGQDCSQLTDAEADACEYSSMEQPGKTARGVCFGYDYYGTTVKSFYTMFQIFTGDSWSEAAVRPILYRFQSSNDLPMLWVSYAFFTSFVFINAVVLVNVVVAVLLESMNKEEKPEQQDTLKLMKDVEKEVIEEIDRVKRRALEVAAKLKAVSARQ